MKNRKLLVIGVAGAIGTCGVAQAQAQAQAQEAAPPHKITAQEVAEALADPSADIMYFNASYRYYLEAGLHHDQENQELRLNAAGFVRLPNDTSILYRGYLPLYSTEFPFDNEGVGDTLLSAYWVPSKGNTIIGFGGAMMLPTATQDYFGTGKVSLGPTLIVAEKVPGKFTVGALLTHVWSVAGDHNRGQVSLSTIQPAVTCFINKKGTSVTLGSESTYNWDANHDPWQVPVTLAVGQVLPPIGKEFIAVAVGGSYYAVRSDFAQKWDIRVVVSVVFP